MQKVTIIFATTLKCRSYLTSSPIEVAIIIVKWIWSVLSSGESYNSLPDTYVIFICDFDPFGLQRYCYSFENLCLEDNTLSLDDGSKSIFLSTKGNNSSDISPELLSFLTFIRENQPEDLRDYHDAYVTHNYRILFIKSNEVRN